MTDLATISLKARDVRCFGAEPQGFDSIAPVNVVIGRNNTGKSALIEAVRYAIERYDLTPFTRRGAATPSVVLGKPITADEAARVFQRNVSGGVVGGPHGAVADAIAGHRVWVKLGAKREQHEFEGLEFDYADRLESMMNGLAHAIEDPFKDLNFRRVAAERDFQPESPCGGDITVSDAGERATTAVERIINEERYDGSLVEQHLLRDLNAIMGPDGQFSRIGIQRDGNGVWFVVLDEAGKGRVSLPESGSGLKSILLVLVNLLLVPVLDGRQLADYVFAFEELESNLHPGLQRRLLSYVEKTVLDSGCTCFITTHAPAIIDLFAGKDHAQVVHVTHDGSKHAWTASYVHRMGRRCWTTLTCVQATFFRPMA